jgi:hypothetical protein
MAHSDIATPTRGGRLTIARSRGAASGIVLILLGIWGAVIAFAGPSFDFAYNPAQGSEWSAARGWLEVLPGAVTVIGGLLLVRSTNRATAMLGAWLSIVAGAWFVVGRVVATTLTIGEIGAPVAPTEAKAAWLELAYFYGLGALIIFLGATALGRVSVRSVRDVAAVERAAVVRHPRDEVVRESDTVSEPVVVDEATTPKHGVVDPVDPVDPVHPGNRVDHDERPRRSWRNAFRSRRRDDVGAAPVAR